MPNLSNLFRKWTLPPERDFGWKMKTLDSAKTSYIIDKDGVIRLNIEHAVLSGVTPKMLLWWFGNIDGEMTINGKSYPKYLVWHPKDHIYWSWVNKADTKKIGIGSYFRIVEAFDQNMKYLIDSTELVEKLDETGIRLVKRIARIEIFSLQHDFVLDGQNTIYKSQMIVGTNNRFLKKVFNLYIRPFIFTNEMAHAWLKHNIEEVGNFEYFLPELYEKEAGNESEYH
jgi:hypothetical protein